MLTNLHFMGNLFNSKENEELASSPWERGQTSLGSDIIVKHIYVSNFYCRVLH